jgi:hypothetical protein
MTDVGEMCNSLSLTTLSLRLSQFPRYVAVYVLSRTTALNEYNITYALKCWLSRTNKFVIPFYVSWNKRLETQKKSK